MTTMTVYRCPCCGGEINFNSDSQKLVCPYCDTAFEVETLKMYEEQLQESQEDKMEWGNDFEHDTLDDEGIVMYSCENCGGEIIGNNETIATSCPYCGSPVVMNKNISGQLKPNYVIPFKLDAKDAKEQLLNFFKDKPFLPHNFKNDSILDEIKGVYVPFWTFGCLADVKQQYKATQVSYYSDNEYDYTKTKYYLVTREGTVEFNNVPVDGSSKIDDEYMQSIEPFDFKEAVDFNTAYLAGYFADKYDEDSKASEPKANKRIQNSTESIFRSTVTGYSTSIIEHSNIQLKDRHVDYYLLPIWILNLKWNDKIYTLMMNGQTGKLIGNLPADMKLFWKSVIGYTVIFAIIIYFILGVV